MSSLAIIPARGGSKRIPGKNIIDFDGKPMITWTIEAALKSKVFDYVVVSTDSEEIAEVSLAAGALVPFLRMNNADDEATSSSATIGALRQAERHWQVRFNQVVQLLPNCPLRDEEDIRDAMQKFKATNINFQISCFRFGWMNPWWAVRINGEMVPSMIFPEAFTKRSQDLEHLYCPTGAIWIAERDALLDSFTFYGPNHRYCPMNWKRAIDIDDMDDYQMALALARVRRKDAI